MSLIAVMGVLLAAPVLAQSPPAVPPPGATTVAPAPGIPRTAGGGRLRARFDAANTTHDGHLTLEQARTGHMGRVAKRFGEIDVAHKGYVTLEDIRAFNRQQRAARGGRTPPQ